MAKGGSGEGRGRQRFTWREGIDGKLYRGKESKEQVSGPLPRRETDRQTGTERERSMSTKTSGRQGEKERE